MGKFANIFRALRKAAGLTQEELAKRLNISRSAVGMYENGAREPDFETLEAIADLFNVDVSYLLGQTAKTTRLIQPAAAVSGTALRIPVLGSVAGGIPIEMIEDIVDYEELPAEMARGGKSFIGLRIKGDSMEPRIWDGDTVIVELMPQVENGQIAIVTVNGEDAACKRFYRYTDRIILDSLNPKYDRREFTAEEAERKPVRVLGRVVEVRGKIN